MPKNELNQVSIQGIVAKDPTSYENGKVVFSIGNHESYGENERTNWINCGAWRSTGEFIKRNFKAGDPIVVTGKIVTWQDKNSDGGAFRWEVNVSNVFFTGSKTRREDPAPVPEYDFNQLPETDLPF